jgi:hypothetical protein
MEENTTKNNDVECGNECINKGRPVYFSYARNSSRKPEWETISDCVDKLLDQFDAENIEYRLDKRDIGAGDRISDFEKEIGMKSEVVVLVFSDKYFRSMHCMYEFVQIKKSLQSFPNKRLFCIKSGDFNLADIKYIMDLEHYWGDMRQDYEAIEYHRLRAHSGTEKAACENGFYMDDIRNLYSFFSAINYVNANTGDWSSFIKDIKKYYIQNPEPPTLCKKVMPPPPPPRNPQPQEPQPQYVEPQQVVQQPVEQPKFADPQPVEKPKETEQQPDATAAQRTQQLVEQPTMEVFEPNKMQEKIIAVVIFILMCLLGFCSVLI